MDLVDNWVEEEEILLVPLPVRLTLAVWVRDPVKVTDSDASEVVEDESEALVEADKKAGVMERDTHVEEESEGE